MLQIAKVLKSNGTEGGILIGLCDITFDQIDLQEPVYIEFDALPVPFFFDSLEPKGSTRAVARITGVNCLRDAEEIVGRDIYADYFEEEDSDEDFTGWQLLDRGRPVGTITGIETIPGNPCLDVETADTEILVPLAQELLISVDAEKKTLDMNVPAGLLPEH